MQHIKKYITLGVILIAIIVFFPFKIINAGNKGIVLRGGAVQGVVDEGIRFKFPVLHKLVEINVQTQKLETEALAYSKDIQTVTTKLALNYHLKPELVNKLYQEVKSDFQSVLIDPAIQESVKAATAKFTAQELIDQRPKVKDEIKAELFNRLSTYFIVDEFSILDFSFSDEFEKAVEAKQVAQQSALKAENDLVRIETEAKQRVAQAKAEAEAIKIQAEAVTQQGGQDYVQLQAILKWDGKLPTQMIPGATVPFINLTK